MKWVRFSSSIHVISSSSGEYEEKLQVTINKARRQIVMHWFIRSTWRRPSSPVHPLYTCSTPKLHPYPSIHPIQVLSICSFIHTNHDYPGEVNDCESYELLKGVRINHSCVNHWESSESLRVVWINDSRMNQGQSSESLEVVLVTVVVQINERVVNDWKTPGWSMKAKIIKASPDNENSVERLKADVMIGESDNHQVDSR